MWFAIFYSETFYPFSCFLTALVSIYGLLSWAPITYLLKQLILTFHHYQLFEEVQMPLSLDSDQKLQCYSLPQEAPVRAGQKRLKVTYLASTDAFLREIRKQNKCAMKNSWKRSFYFPHSDFIICGKAIINDYSHNLNYNLTKLTQTYKRIKAKKRLSFIPTTLPTILEFECY